MKTALAIALTAPVAAVNWAVIVAGSNGWWNYRHQADVAHARQILKRGGFADEHIVTMVFDGLVEHKFNPFKGKVFNRPTTDIDADNVWDGIKIDYSGKEVNPRVFLSVMTGDKAGAKGGKVLQSTSEDNVFVFYSNHGSRSKVYMPARGGVFWSNYVSDVQLKKAVQRMQSKKMFKNMLIYVEACFSGSMFDASFPAADSNVMGVAAANDRQSSYAAYCDIDETTILGQNLATCLGDEFSVAWMEALDDQKNGYNRTLRENFDYLKNKVFYSEVTGFGDANMANSLHMSDFLVQVGSPIPPPKKRNAPPVDVRSPASFVDSRDIRLHALKTLQMRASKLRFAATPAALKDLTYLEQAFAAQEPSFGSIEEAIAAEEKHRADSDAAFAAIRAAFPLTEEQKGTSEDCGECCETAEALLSSGEDRCRYTDYSLKHSWTVFDVCMTALKTGEDMQEITQRLTQVVKSVCYDEQEEAIVRM